MQAGHDGRGELQEVVGRRCLGRVSPRSPPAWPCAGRAASSDTDDALCGAAMASVGIIANPAAGKDIRRLVAHASTFDNLEKVNIVRRVLLGLQGAGVTDVLYIPDAFGISARALHRSEERRVG